MAHRRTDLILVSRRSLRCVSLSARTTHTDVLDAADDNDDDKLWITERFDTMSDDPRPADVSDIHAVQAVVLTSFEQIFERLAAER